jgi:predicted RNase H-like HicB family nuclease
MTNNKYPINIAWSDEDGGYVATCPAFPGLSALGKTEETALVEAKVALEGFIESCEANGIPLPQVWKVE